MRTPTVIARFRPRSRLRAGISLIRVRLWVAMLGLAILPMLGVILLTNAFTTHEPTVATEQQRWETASAAADLAERLRAIEVRLAAMAADPELRPLHDGVAGAEERQLAERALAALSGGDSELLVSVCVGRADGSAIPLVATGREGAAANAADGTSTSSCEAITPPTEIATRTVARSTSLGPARTQRLVLSTPLVGSKRDAGILSAAIDPVRLFEQTPGMVSTDGASVLVDLGSRAIVAVAQPNGTAEGASTTDPDAAAMPSASFVPGDLAVRITGILSGHAGTARSLEQAGWVASSAPLWSTDDGVRLGLVRLWPAAPSGPNTLLLAALVTFAVVVLLIAVIVAWSFLRPFDDLARSQAQLEVLYREAREDSLHDGLTGLGNHRSFQEELDRQLELFRRHKVPVALLLLDLDDLKVVNDGEGHPAGDRLLLGMANSIRDALRYGDRPFRIGGDEFAVILPHTDANEALIAANRLRHFCLRPPAGERAIPFSGGISSVPLLAADRTELFRQADAAMYRCKRNGRGTVAVYDPDRDVAEDQAVDAASVVGVRDVIRMRRLTPVFQPIVDLRDGAVLGFEGLVRPAPGSPFTNPGQLFSAAAAAGRTVELDLACFEVVAAGAGQIDAAQVVSINLSPLTLEVPGFSASWLLEILARYRLSPGRVIVELTEREAITDLESVRRNLAALQHAGVRIAADDVGAGNAGLRLLSQLRFDIVKIDLSLVQDGIHHDSSRNVVRSLMDLAARQGAVAIAEGLETAEQLRSLRELGLITGQGYLLGRPGQNLGLTRVDIEALAAGALIVQNTPAQRPADVAAAGASAVASSAQGQAAATAPVPVPAAPSAPVQPAASHRAPALPRPASLPAHVQGSAAP